MTIDREQLLSLLAERTSFDQERVDEQFTELTDRVQQAKDKQSTLHIEGFGTFKCINDRLEFKPAGLLETEINNKYTGMKPIELIGAFKEPGGADVPIADLSDEEEVLDYKDLPEEQQQVEEAEPQEAETEKPSGTAEEIAAESEEPKEEEAAKETPTEEKKAQTAPAAKSQPAAVTDEQEEKDPLGKAILILAIIIALGVAGWMAYDLGFFGDDPDSNTSSAPTEEQTETVDPTASPNNSEPEQTANNTEYAGANNEVNASTEQAQSQAESNESASSSVEDTPYGLYGELNSNISTGYFTIVVHSLRTMDLAKEKKKPLLEEGFRTIIKEASVNSQTYFRVSVGQFSTVEAAQKMVQELPEPYKSNNFINRF
jgi:chemotaxis protein histidine kinase CheA